MDFNMDVAMLGKRLRSCEICLAEQDEEVEGAFKASQQELNSSLEAGVASIQAAMASMDKTSSTKEQSLTVQSRQIVESRRQKIRMIGNAFEYVSKVAGDLMVRFMKIQKSAIDLEVEISVLQRDTGITVVRAEENSKYALKRVNARAKERKTAKQKLEALEVSIRSLEDRKENLDEDRNILRVLRAEKVSIKDGLQTKKAEISHMDAAFKSLKSEEKEAQASLEAANHVCDNCAALNLEVSRLKETVGMHIQSYQKVKNAATELSLWADELSVEANGISYHQVASMANGLQDLLLDFSAEKQQQLMWICEPIESFQKLNMGPK
ncbi:predicted protein [Uncinocarpus reesii 1704]|uniref:Uncharacterized protein n=1 Tax=Uncinocarpus reesii (strain UAMH 1704) TaxID=336963 RepID=C4JMJ8_UNCRE|nr:uncharacterized protein UREG_04056 [Uncinocarpus reesii 1704]EEP79210.1 predicted protein [Uncinocarpus reesii 1704]